MLNKYYPIGMQIGGGALRTGHPAYKCPIQNVNLVYKYCL